MKGTVAKAELTALFAEVWRSSGNKIERLDVKCWRRFKTDHLCRSKTDQGLLLT